MAVEYVPAGVRCTVSPFPIDTGMGSPPGHHYHEDTGDCADANLEPIFVRVAVDEMSPVFLTRKEWDDVLSRLASFEQDRCVGPLEHDAEQALQRRIRDQLG